MLPPLPTECQDLLRAMVGFDTVNASLSGRPDAERALGRYLEGLADAMGLDTLRVPVGDAGFNLLVSHRAGEDRPWLLFVSHMDTVGVDAMTIDPFAGRVVDGRLYGRGACDTKGSGAAMLWALKAYAESGDSGNNIAIAFTLDEEIGKAGVYALVDHLPKLPWRPAGAIVGEPTLLRPVVAHNGCVRWTIRTRGVAAHSSDPTRGRSAISAMMRVVDALESRYIPAITAAHPLTGRAVCSVNRIHGGTSVNVIPESCTIELDRRIVPGEDMHAVLPAVEAVLDTLRAELPGIEVVQDKPFLDPGLDPAGHEGLIEPVRRVLCGLGIPDEPLGVRYSTEASDLARAGVPALVLGPGDIAAAHTRDESIELAQLDLAVRVYVQLMRTPLAEGA